MLVKILKNNKIMLLFFVVIGMLICSLTRFDFPWDLTNYHLYNAFALLNNRYEKDIAIACVHGFFNPLIELPLYVAIKFFNDYPMIVSGFQGIWYGLLLFVFFKVVGLFFNVKENKDIFPYILTIAIAATGTATWFQAGSSTNEIPIAFLSYISIYILLKQIKYPEQQNKYKYLVAGLIMGLALGMKATSITMCIGTGICVLLFAKSYRTPLVFVSFFVVGGLTGYLVTNGWWMYKMWQLYENPFFPFLNKIFHSSYYADSNFSDRRFIPPVNKMLIFPYLWMQGKYHPAETDFNDIRAPIYYTVIIALIIYNTIKTIRIEGNKQTKNMWKFFILWVSINYILWMLLFSIHRYLVVIEMACSIILVKTLFLYTPDKIIKKILYYTFICIISGILILNVKEGKPCPYRHHEDKFVSMEKVVLPSNTLLKLINLPVAGVIPLLAWSNKNDFKSLGYVHSSTFDINDNISQYGKMKERRDKIEKKHQGPIILVLRSYSNFGEYYKNSLKDNTLDIKLYKNNPNLLKKMLEQEEHDKDHLTWEYIKREHKDMYCRRLKTNIYKDLYICVPEDLKDEILPEGDNDE